MARGSRDPPVGFVMEKKLKRAGDITQGLSFDKLDKDTERSPCFVSPPPPPFFVTLKCFPFSHLASRQIPKLCVTGNVLLH